MPLPYQVKAFTVTLQRYFSNSEETCGLLFVDNVFVADCLEDEHREEKVPGETRIPAGEYDLVLEYSPKFSERYGHEMLTVKDVPGFTGIRIHRGQTEKDTAGCLLVGWGVNRVGNKFRSALLESSLGYARFYEIVSSRLRAGEKARIRILDEPNRG